MSKSIKVNPDLNKERKNVTFDTEEFSVWWYGGAEKLKQRREMENFFLSDPELNNDIPLSCLSHKEKYEQSLRRAVIAFRKVKELQTSGSDGIESYMALMSGLLGAGVTPEGNPLGLHYVMFLPTIMGQGTPQQQAEWMGRAWNGEIIGTYAQTELGHGTFIRGLETTATYDPKTEEFVLNSPTLTSYKWWPGGLGHTANYCIVIAQLYIKEKCYGIHSFIVQLRDEETHHPMTGIVIGDIGPKIGMNGVNNGFLGFKSVRIPRHNMLMKNSQVKSDGTYIKAPSSVLTYGTMVFVRVVVCRDMSYFLAKSATIATRYSAVRRQSPIDPSKPEPQIIEHVTQQHKLFPAIAKSVVFKSAADQIWETYNQVTGELDQGNVNRLPELHAISCCLKAVCTADAAAETEKLRLACGGHGYLQSSGLPLNYGFVTAACTYEGENTVLLLQTARFLMKAWTSTLNKEPLTPTVAYLSFEYTYGGQSHWDPSLSGIVKAFQTVAASKIRIAHENIEKRKRQGLTHEDATNQTSIELASAAEAHCRTYLLQCNQHIAMKELQGVSPPLQAVILQLTELYAVDACFKGLGDLHRFTKISEKDILELQSRLEKVLSQIRLNAVGIVDGFDIPDKILGSTLGAYDGNVYERLYEEAMKNPLNHEPVNKSFDLHLKPAIKAKL